MNQRTHAWIAIRAIKLLEDEGLFPDLVKLLKPFTKKASIGAWIPDKRDAKLGTGLTQNHVFKIGPYTGPEGLQSRFIVDKKKMLKFLGPERLMHDFIVNHSDILDEDWWSKPYKSDPPPGKHLANRAMALDINNIDLLILGDPIVQDLVPGSVSFIKNLSTDALVRPCQVALFFFMQSHFIADALMPCHCDDRNLSDYNKGIHKNLEEHWGNKIGMFFDEGNLLKSSQADDEILKIAENVDEVFNIKFNRKIPVTKTKDIWEEVVLLCRGSFAIASVMAPHSVYKYKPNDRILPSYNALFNKDQITKDLLSELDEVILHDAVLNVAMVWKDIWLKFNN